VRPQVEVLHGVNFDVLGRRPAAHYGGLTLEQLEVRIKREADELGMTVTFFQSNHEGDYCEELHNTTAAGLILNPGAWTHYSWAIRDALEIAGLPAVEVHLSDVEDREAFRRVSVLEGVVVGKVFGHGVDGYRIALEQLKAALA
jgi:3-dehydroquinate dehydratase II